MKIFFILLSSLLSYAPSAIATPPLALVYNGPGACFQCWISASITAQKAGFRVQLVKGRNTPLSSFQKAKLWVQPGGNSRKAAAYLGEKGLEKIRSFVENGGGYTGFCAGGFLSTAEVGTSGMKGLGILPGKTKLHDRRDGPAAMIDVHWEGKKRSILYHGGPHFNLQNTNDPNLKVIATYDEDFGEESNISAVTTQYGKGRVAVNGFHAEAAKFWKMAHFLRDQDGSDQDLAIEFMRWSANL